MKNFSSARSTSGSLAAASTLTALKDFDWRRLQRLTDPQTMKDLDKFLDNLPLRAGKNALIIASVMWIVAAAGLFLLYHDTLSLRDIQKQLSLAEGAHVTVPEITYTPVDLQMIKPLVDKLKKIYPTLTFEIQDSSQITVQATTTRDYPVWRAAIGDLANGAAGWKLSVKNFCTGSACGQSPLTASILVQNINIQLPVAPAEDAGVEATDKTAG